MMKPEKRSKTLSGLVIICLLLIIIIVLACIYGTDLNCARKAAADEPTQTKSVGPAMVKYENIMGTKGMVKLGNTNAKAWMKTISFSSVPGKEMQAGVLKLESGAALMYTHW